MPYITSQFRSGLDNLSVDSSQVNSVELSAPSPVNPRLWVTYFMKDEGGQGKKVVRTWFYTSEADRNKDLERIREKFPNIAVD